MEQWFEIWGHNLVTTSNLALNRAWLARIPNLQTGDDFVNIDTLDYARELHQFSQCDPCAIACKRNDLAFLEMLLTRGFKPDHKAFKYAFSFGSLELIKRVLQEANITPIGLYLKRAAKLGRRDVIQWALKKGWIEHGIAFGAAKHSAEMLEWVFEQAPSLKIRSVELTTASLRSDACHYLIRQGLSAAETSQYKRLIKFGRMAMFRKLVAIFGPPTQQDCSWVAATKGLSVLQEVSKYIAPDGTTVFFAAKTGDKESLLWLRGRCDDIMAWGGRCDGSMAWDGAALHSVEMLNFVEDKFPSTPLEPIYIWTKQFSISLKVVLWAERRQHQINYDQVLFDALMNCQPRLVHYVREKTKLTSWHLRAALYTGNFIQAQWLIDHQCPNEDLLDSLSDIYDLDIWKFAKQHNLYEIAEAPQWFEKDAPDVLQWLKDTGQIP